MNMNRVKIDVAALRDNVRQFDARRRIMSGGLTMNSAERNWKLYREIAARTTLSIRGHDEVLWRRRLHVNRQSID